MSPGTWRISNLVHYQDTDSTLPPHGNSMRVRSTAQNENTLAQKSHFGAKAKPRGYGMLRDKPTSDSCWNVPRKTIGTMCASDRICLDGMRHRGADRGNQQR